MREPRGVVAPDGSPVELYQSLPSVGEPEIVHAAIPGGATILKLGCSIWVGWRSTAGSTTGTPGSPPGRKHDAR